MQSPVAQKVQTRPGEADVAASPQLRKAKPGVSRSTVNFCLDTVLALAFSGVLTATLIAEAVFPNGTQAAGWSVWGLGYDTWRMIQSITIYVFALGVLVHLILHWAWVFGFVVTRISKRRGGRLTYPEAYKTVFGVGTLIVVLTMIVMVVIAAQLGAVAPAKPDAAGAASSR